MGRTRGGGGGGVVGGGGCHPHKVFVSFFREDKPLAPHVHPSPHFETSLVMVSCYDYKI